MKRKLVAAVLMVLLAFGMTSALADAGGWGEWIIDPRTGEEVFSFVPQDWGNGELGMRVFRCMRCAGSRRLQRLARL